MEKTLLGDPIQRCRRVIFYIRE